MRNEEIRSGHYYHLYNRGVNRQPIFFAQANWAFFIERMRHYFGPNWVEMVAYCLMPNHYHMLVCARCDDLGHRIMQPFTVSYTKAINKQQDRVGPLFQGPFQARLVDEDRYLNHLSRYIHLNPVMAGLVNKPEQWIFSSYRDYVGLRKGTLPDPTIVMSQFPSAQAYVAYVRSYQPQNRQIIEHLLFEEEE
jgi:REP element-mobilizing transposase RayT